MLLTRDFSGFLLPSFHLLWFWERPYLNPLTFFHVTFGSRLEDGLTVDLRNMNRLAKVRWVVKSDEDFLLGYRPNISSCDIRFCFLKRVLVWHPATAEKNLRSIHFVLTDHATKTYWAWSPNPCVTRGQVWDWHRDTWSPWCWWVYPRFGNISTDYRFTRRTTCWKIVCRDLQVQCRILTNFSYKCWYRHVSSAGS